MCFLDCQWTHFCFAGVRPGDWFAQDSGACWGDRQGSPSHSCCHWDIVCVYLHHHQILRLQREISRDKGSTHSQWIRTTARRQPEYTDQSLGLLAVPDWIHSMQLRRCQFRHVLPVWQSGLDCAQQSVCDAFFFLLDQFDNAKVESYGEQDKSGPA